MATFCDPTLMVQRRGPGKVAGWMVCTIVIACVVTFAAITIGLELLVAQLSWSPRHVDLGWMRYGLTFVVAFWMLASWLPPSNLSRPLRVAVLLPGLHALTIGLAWPMWHAIAPALPRDGAASTFVLGFPLLVVAAATVLGFAVFAALFARRRSGDWIHGFAMLSLAELLLVGLWLPIACAAWPGGPSGWWSSSNPLLVDANQVAFVVIPPTLVALAFTGFALRRPSSLPRRRTLVMQMLGVAFVVALIARITATARVMVLYTNFVPLVLVLTIVAIAALLALGTLTWWRAAVAQRALRRRACRHGAIVPDGDDDPAVGVEITSWLRGPRIVQRSFAVSTADGTLPVRGAHVVTALPAATTQLHAGECMPLLRPGDGVTIAARPAAGGDPFRTPGGPIASDVLVAPALSGRLGFTNVALAMWRPCLAYLLIVTTIALPGLVALLAD